MNRGRSVFAQLMDSILFNQFGHRTARYAMIHWILGLDSISPHRVLPTDPPKRLATLLDEVTPVPVVKCWWHRIAPCLFG